MITDVIIKGVKKEKIEEGFYVDIEYMYGDADGYKTKTFGPFHLNQKKYLMHFLNMLESCLNAYPNGRSGFDDYEDIVEDIKIWDVDYERYDDLKIDKNFKQVIQQIGFDIERVPCGLDMEASIIAYSVKYYDQNDGYHDVEIKKNNC